MNIALFGSTGSVGQHLINQALDQGHTVTAFTRDPSKLTKSHDHLNPCKGDIHDLSAVERATKGQDAVICALGMPLLNNDKLRSIGTKNIINAMNTTGVTRLICLSSMGTADSHQLLPAKYKYLIAPLFMRRLFADHALQEQSIRQSNLDWTIIRPGAFTKDTLASSPATYRHGFTSADTKTKAQISRPHVAEFLLKQLTDNTYLHKSPSISY